VLRHGATPTEVQQGSGSFLCNAQPWLTALNASNNVVPGARRCRPEQRSALRDVARSVALALRSNHRHVAEPRIRDWYEVEAVRVVLASRCS
jgi:hypothetical protein